MSKLVVRCSYCPTLLRCEPVDIQLTARAALVMTITCPACDSKTELHVSTKRKSKGKRQRASEAKAEAERLVLVAEADARNDEIAKVLLAEPGCTCAVGKEQRAYYAECRPDGLDSGGTGANRIPNAPRHRYSCPVRAEGREASPAGFPPPFRPVAK